MNADVRALVLDALDVLDLEHHSESQGILRVRIPERMRAFLGDTRQLRLVFDPDVWQHDRTTDLVAPGSPVMIGLESALRAGAAVSVRVGGDLMPDPSIRRAWDERMQVLNAVVEGEASTVTSSFVVRFLYEVRLVGPPPTMELIPVAWSEAKRRILSPTELGELRGMPWYEPSELRAFSALEFPNWGPSLDRARVDCHTHLQGMLESLLSRKASRRALRARQLEDQYRYEANERLREHQEKSGGNDSVILEIQEELKQRLAQLTEALEARCAVLERTIQVFQVCDSQLLLRLRAGRGGAVVNYSVPTRNGGLRDDLCRTCSEPRRRYYLDARRGDLLCDECAIPCRDDACFAFVGKGDKSACSLCSSARYCSDHVEGCGRCGRGACREHRLKVECGAWFCVDHKPPMSRGERLVCDKHSMVCSVDGLRTHADDMIACAVTGKKMYKGNAVKLANDDRQLHPSAVIECSFTGEQIATDRVASCEVDGGLVDRTFLKSIEDTQVCPAHTVELDEPAGRLARSDRVAVCALTQRTLHKRDVATCSVDGRTYGRNLMTTCPITDKILFRQHAVDVGDGRLLHPAGVVTCGKSGDQLATDGAAYCAVDGAPFHPRFVAISVEGETLCPTHGVEVDLPRGAVIRRANLRVCAATRTKMSPSVARVCSIRGKVYRPGLVFECPLTAKQMHRDEAIHPAGDSRSLHPDGCVRSALSGQWVARDAAVLDQFEDRLLHPDEVGVCELSHRSTALQSLQMVDCCGRNVARPLSGISPISGVRWCRDHARRCAHHHVMVALHESVTCAISGQQLCTEHTVTAKCGRRVAVEHGRNLGNGWGCSDHYGECGPGHHPVQKDQMVSCTVCGDWTCTSHGIVHAYDQTARSCTIHLIECARCGMKDAPRQGSDDQLCLYCRGKTRLSKSGPGWDDCQKLIKPRVGWAAWRVVAVFVSGTDRVRVFEVQGPLSTTFFRVIGGDVRSRKAGRVWPD